MNPLEQLKSVLCDPTGRCSIAGSDEDRKIVDRALSALTAKQSEPCAKCAGRGWYICGASDQKRKCYECIKSHPAPKAEPVNQQLMEALKNLCTCINETRGINADAALYQALAAIAAAEQAQPAELTDDELWSIWDAHYEDVPSYDRPSYEPTLYRAVIAAQGAKQ